MDGDGVEIEDPRRSARMGASQGRSDEVHMHLIARHTRKQRCS